MKKNEPLVIGDIKSNFEDLSLTKKKQLERVINRINNGKKGNAVMDIESLENTLDNVISTGIPGLDDALGVGGIKNGSMIEIFGTEDSGKTALALYLARQYQKAGKPVLYIDSERALIKETIKNAGIENENFYVMRENSLENALNACLEASKAFGAVIIDSFAGLTTTQQLSENIENGNYSYYISSRISSALPVLAAYLSEHNCTLIIINQLREKVGALFGNPEYSTGGRALKYFFTARIHLQKTEVLREYGDIIGIRSRAKVVKNKLSTPYRETEFNIIFGQGVTVHSK